MAEVAPDTVGEVAVLDIEAAAASLQQGKELIDDDPEKAVELLCAAVRAYEKHYGDVAIECAPVYMYYGIALYEVARSSTDALGTTKTTVEPVPDRKTDQAPPAAANADAGNPGAPESKDEGKAGTAELVIQDDHKAAESGALKDASNDDADEGKEDVGEEAKAADGTANADNEEGDERGGEEGGEEDGEEGDEERGEEGGDGKPEEDVDSDDMKLAWDMLEIARVIYSKQPNPEAHHERLAEVHKALGDIKSEEERFEEAVECFKQSLQHLESMQPRNNRRLAEVQYKLSVVLTYLEQHEEALAVTHLALSSLEAAVAETEEKLSLLPTDGSGGEAADEEGRRLQGVSDDLRSVISELHWNISGLKETIASNNSLKEALRQAFLKASGGGADAASGATAGLAAALAAGASNIKSFPTPSARAVSLGTVGRGSKRITLQPTKVAAAPTLPPTATIAAAAVADANGGITAPGVEPPQPIEAAEGSVAAAEAPAMTPASEGPSAATASKRTLEELMEGVPATGGVTSAVFGAVVVVETREEGQQPVAKKARTEEPEVEAAAMTDV